MTSAHSPSLETVPYLLIFYVVTYRRLSGLTFRGLAQVSVVHIRCRGIIHCLYCCFSCSVYTHSRYPSRSYLRHVAVDGLALTFVFFIRGNLPYDCTALGTIHSGIEGIHCTGDRQRQTSRPRRRRRERVRNDGKLAIHQTEIFQISRVPHRQAIINQANSKVARCIMTDMSSPRTYTCRGIG